ncbi:MAG: cobyric acid synthase CobQ [Rhodobacterales bacterium]|nr:MAG: cobyric acid synthase CobQ [Rhodobacterales bacterium]
MAKSLMIQGTGSNVGKSMLVAGLARAFRRRGLKTCPFKPQNMSNNAAVTRDGGEIGRAQALQARAAGLAPVCDMNPVLLKPESDIGAAIILQGKHLDTLKARDFSAMKHTLMPAILDSFHRLSANADLMLIEGAGSPAEINLRENDLANMGFAEAANVPVVLVGDIDRGGVIAQMVGSHAILPAEDRDRIKAFIINKFRGDVTLFTEGRHAISERTGWADIGVLPWFEHAWKLPAEDVIDICSTRGGNFKIAVPRLSRIANFDDLDPLAAEPDVSLEIIPPGQPLPGDADLVLIPGSKSTIADLHYFRAQGWEVDLKAHLRRGGHVLGLCGGYQMLGREIIDPHGIEGHAGRHQGLGLLNINTEMSADKQLKLCEATYLPSGNKLQGYEIHIGHSTGPDQARAWLEIDGHRDGAASENGRVMGCYMHGLFAADGFRAAYLQRLGRSAAASALDYEAEIDTTLDALAAHVEAHLDLDALLRLAR